MKFTVLMCHSCSSCSWILGVGVAFDVFYLWYSKADFSPICTNIVLTITPYSRSSSITTNCLTQLYTNISGWPNICSHLHFHKPPSHLHHLDKRWNRTLRWQHPLLVTVACCSRVSHLPQHPDSHGKAPRAIWMPCHHWSMGESANIHTKCQ